MEEGGGVSYRRAARFNKRVAAETEGHSTLSRSDPPAASLCLCVLISATAPSLKLLKVHYLLSGLFLETMLKLHKLQK